MNRRALLLLVTLLALTLVLPQVLGFSGGDTKPSSADALKPAKDLAQALSIITGTAVSPLLGVGAFGACKYLRTLPAERGGLPWFAQPWFWIPALLAVVAVFAKDALGAALPAVLKKPFDLVELFENKLSALVAAGAFVPLMISVFPAAPGLQSGWSATPGLAFISWGAWGNALMAPVAIMLFLMVWLTAHTVHVLILISPFSSLDLALKMVRFGLLASIALTAWVHPYFGAVWALIIMVCCFFTGGWSFRLMVMGAVFAWDLLTLRSRRFHPASTGQAFTARAIEEVPPRSYGVLSRNPEGRLVFEYRPWLILPARRLTMPAGPYLVGRGLVHPELLHGSAKGKPPLLRFPPRYRGHEETLATVYGVAGVEQIGLCAAWRWLKDWLGFAQDLPAAV